MSSAVLLVDHVGQSTWCVPHLERCILGNLQGMFFNRWKVVFSAYRDMPWRCLRANLCKRGKPGLNKIVQQSAAFAGHVLEWLSSSQIDGWVGARIQLPLLLCTTAQGEVPAAIEHCWCLTLWAGSSGFMGYSCYPVFCLTSSSNSSSSFSPLTTLGVLLHERRLQEALMLHPRAFST